MFHVKHPMQAGGPLGRNANVSRETHSLPVKHEPNSQDQGWREPADCLEGSIWERPSGFCRPRDCDDFVKKSGFTIGEMASVRSIRGRPFG